MISHYKDPYYEPISMMESQKGFERCSGEVVCS